MESELILVESPKWFVKLKDRCTKDKPENREPFYGTKYYLWSYFQNKYFEREFSEHTIKSLFKLYVNLKLVYVDKENFFLIKKQQKRLEDAS